MGSELSKYQVGQTVYVRGLTDINSPYIKCKVIKKTSSGIITLQSENSKSTYKFNKYGKELGIGKASAWYRNGIYTEEEMKGR